MSIFYQNCRGVKSKLEQLRFSLINNDCDIIALSETWLNKSIATAEFSLDDRICFRRDRNKLVTGKSQGGGVLLAVRNCYIITEYQIFDEDQEAVCVKIKLNNNYFLYVVLVYIVPNSSCHVYEKFFEKIESNILHMVNNFDLIIIGDFNIPTYVQASSSCENLNVLKSFLAFNNLSQSNHIKNNNDVILDLVICSFDNVCVTEANESLLPIDIQHPCLGISLETKHPFKSCKLVSTTKYNFRKADFLLMYQLIKNQKWDILKSCIDVNVALDTFYSILGDILGISVPKSTQIDKRYPIWFNKQIILLIKKKYSYLRKSRKFRSHYWRSKYVNLRSVIKVKIKEAYLKYLFDVKTSLKSNPKFFWSYVKGLRDYSDVLQEMVYNERSYTGPQNVANGFADFFKSVFIDDADVTCSKFTVMTRFCDNLITRDEIMYAINKIKGNRAIGPDGIPAYILKGCSEYLLIPLKFLFNLILKTSIYPDKWKLSKVIPVYKSGSRQNICNYRPISIVCAISKIFEVVIFERLYNEISGKLTLSQHGFLPKKSTFTNLITFSQYIHDAINNKSQVDVIYTDMEKAFDRVRHCVILKALGEMDVSPYLIFLLQSYLGNRSQYIEIKGCRSVVYKSTSGVPQGSNLGPLLFLTAVNNITEHLDSVKGLLFADDFKLFHIINSTEDCETLQKDFCNIANWCTTNSFNLNVSKCMCMSFTLNKNSNHYDYTYNNSKIQRVENQKDLGVIFDVNLNFVNHITSKIENAQKVAGFIARNTREFDIDIGLHLFDSLVLPILEYGSVIWSPQYDVWITLLESVQRKFLKCLYFRKYGHYPQRGCDNEYLLGVFGRLSLEKRRTKIILCTMFKLLKGELDSPDILGQLPFAINRINSRNPNTFYLAFPRTNLFRNSPIFRMCSLFNKYASDVDIDLINLSKFKQKIDSKLRLNI